MSNRDDFTVPTKKLLAARVSYKCSNPDCRRITIGPNKKDDKSTNIGVASHICAAASGGPRFNEKMTKDERTNYSNGIWLCATCSVLIDKDTNAYSVELLQSWKKTAEELAEAELNNTLNTSGNHDKEIVEFYLKCFDRPAFQDEIRCEGSVEHLGKAIEDTLIAINTGVLFDRGGRILSQSKSKSLICDTMLKNKVLLISDLLQALLRELEIASNKQSFFQREDGFYCFNSRSDEEWFDITRNKILSIIVEICNDYKMQPLPYLRKNPYRRYF